jgi:hypothetical protein
VTLQDFVAAAESFWHPAMFGTQSRFYPLRIRLDLPKDLRTLAITAA